MNGTAVEFTGLELVNSVRTSAEIGNLAAAFATAQGNITTVGKNAKNPHYRSEYADLAAVREAAIPHLNRQGLAVLQFPVRAGDGLSAVTTRILHRSGEWIESTCAARLSKDDAQGLGSCITYLRRYSLAAITGLAQDDDDGNAAAERQGASSGEDARGGSKKPSPSSPRQRGERTSKIDVEEFLEAFAKVTTQRQLDQAREAVRLVWRSLSEEQRVTLNNAKEEAGERLKELNASE